MMTMILNSLWRKRSDIECFRRDFERNYMDVISMQMQRMLHLLPKNRDAVITTFNRLTQKYFENIRNSLDDAVETIVNAPSK